jgi:ketosteroid isomerase-like protein
MSTVDVAQKLVSMCKERRDHEALNELFSPDAVSVEAMSLPNMPQEARGLDAIKAKGDWWRKNNEVHSVGVEGPFPNGDRFAVRFTYDVTQKQSGQRIKMDEVALYTVKNDKIVREEFFYPTG